jgi:hypothetical protein
MATHNKLQSMSVEAINEYLAIAEHCVSTRKMDGGVYGYPSILLLFCIIDAVSNYVGRPKNTLLGIQSIFPELTEKQISDLKKWYRNLLTHQAIIMPGTQLSDDREGTPIEFGLGGEPTHIRVIPFCRVVKRWWETFDKSLIDPKFDPKQAPKKPVPTTTSLPGILGSHVTKKY